MARSRFYKLTPEKQALILTAATHEFAQFGLVQAKYNRVIEQARVSKGAMYYYFDDKEDLYLTVIEQQLIPRCQSISSTPTGTTSQEFWSGIRRWWTQFSFELNTTPTARNLLRDFVRHAQTPGCSDRIATTYNRLAEPVREKLLAGARIHAVRSDIPVTLLLSMILKLSEAIDLWNTEGEAQLTNEPLHGGRAAIAIEAVYNLAQPLLPRATVSSEIEIRG